MINIINIIEKLKTLRFIDTMPFGRKKYKLVFLCSDADKAIEKNKLLYSQIIDPLLDYCIIKKIPFTSISIPFSKLSRFSTYSQSHTLNWAYLLRRNFFWRWLFAKKINTKIIVGIGIPEQLNLFAKQNNIKTFELMHGFGLGDSDYIWGVNAKKNMQDKTRADNYIVYDWQTHKTLKKSIGSNCSKVEIARHHFFDREIYSGFNSIEKTREKFSNKNLLDDKKNVLITLQHGYDGATSILKGILQNGLIHEELINYIKVNDRINWIVKPHPVQVKSHQWGIIHDKIKEIFTGCENVKFIDFINDDIFAILHFVDAHITMCSGAVVEAAMLGVPSLGLCPSLQQGGAMQDAFIIEEQDGLFERGFPTYKKIDDFIFKIPILKTRGTCQQQVYKNYRELPSAFDYISKEF